MPVGRYSLSGSKDGYLPSQPVEVEVTEDESTPVPTVVLRSITGIIEIDGGAAFTNAHEREVMPWQALKTRRTIAVLPSSRILSRQEFCSDARNQRVDSAE